jgi:hypothetical protein
VDAKNTSHGSGAVSTAAPPKVPTAAPNSVSRVVRTKSACSDASAAVAAIATTPSFSGVASMFAFSQDLPPTLESLDAIAASQVSIRHAIDTHLPLPDVSKGAEAARKLNRRKSTHGAAFKASVFQADLAASAPAPAVDHPMQYSEMSDEFRPPAIKVETDSKDRARTVSTVASADVEALEIADVNDYIGPLPTLTSSVAGDLTLPTPSNDSHFFAQQFSPMSLVFSPSPHMASPHAFSHKLAEVPKESASAIAAPSQPRKKASEAGRKKPVRKGRKSVARPHETQTDISPFCVRAAVPTAPQEQEAMRIDELDGAAPFVNFCDVTEIIPPQSQEPEPETEKPPIRLGVDEAFVERALPAALAVVGGCTSMCTSARMKYAEMSHILYDNHTSSSIAFWFSLQFLTNGALFSTVDNKACACDDCVSAAAICALLHAVAKTEQAVCKRSLSHNNSSLRRNEDANRKFMDEKLQSTDSLDSTEAEYLACSRISHCAAPIMPQTPQRQVSIASSICVADVPSPVRDHIKGKAVRFATTNFSGVEGQPSRLNTIFTAKVEKDAAHVKYRSAGGSDQGVLCFMLAEVQQASTSLMQLFGKAGSISEVSRTAWARTITMLQIIAACRGLSTWSELASRISWPAFANVSSVLNALPHAEWQDVSIGADLLLQELSLLSNNQLPFMQRFCSAASSAIRFHLRQAFNSHVMDEHFETHSAANTPKLAGKDGKDADLHSSHSSFRESHVHDSKTIMQRAAECGGVGNGGGAVKAGYVGVESIDPAVADKVFNKWDIAAMVHNAMADVWRNRAAVCELIAPHTLQNEAAADSFVGTASFGMTAFAPRTLSMAQMVDRAPIQDAWMASRFCASHSFLRSVLGLQQVIDALAGNGTAWRNLRTFARMAKSHALVTEQFLTPLENITDFLLSLDEEAAVVDKLLLHARQSMERHRLAYERERECRGKRRRESVQSVNDTYDDSSTACASRRPKKQGRFQSRLNSYEDVSTSRPRSHSPPQPSKLFGRQRSCSATLFSPSPANKRGGKGNRSPASSPLASGLSPLVHSLALSDDAVTSRGGADATDVAMSLSSLLSSSVDVTRESLKHTRAEQLAELEDVLHDWTSFVYPTIKFIPHEEAAMPSKVIVDTPAPAKQARAASAAPVVQAQQTGPMSFNLSFSSAIVQHAPVPAARSRKQMQLFESLEADVTIHPIAAPSSAGAFLLPEHASTPLSPCRLFGGCADLLEPANACGECHRAVVSNTFVRCHMCARPFHLVCFGLPANFLQFEADGSIHMCNRCR